MFTPEESIAEFERIIKEADKAYDSMMDDFTVYGAKIILKLLKDQQKEIADLKAKLVT